jgi:hypothetical protein
MSKIIFIEGNPGSGKTTFAKRLETILSAMGQSVKMFQEGDLHPIDLAWCAILDHKNYQKILHDYPMIKEDILKLSKKLEDDYVIAYTKVDHKIAPREFYDHMATFEIYQTKTLKPFQDTHQKLWNAFPGSMDRDTIYIFECVFIQNHINELILKYHLTEEEIFQYFNELIKPLVPLNPIVFFIEQLDVKQSIEHVAKERKTDDKTKFKDWIDLVVDYIEDTPYALKLGYTGYEGIIQYFKDRQTLSLKLLNEIPVTSMILSLNNNHDELFSMMLHKVKSLL